MASARCCSSFSQSQPLLIDWFVTCFTSRLIMCSLSRRAPCTTKLIEYTTYCQLSTLLPQHSRVERKKKAIQAHEGLLEARHKFKPLYCIAEGGVIILEKGAYRPPSCRTQAVVTAPRVPTATIVWQGVSHGKLSDDGGQIRQLWSRLRSREWIEPILDPVLHEPATVFWIHYLRKLYAANAK